MACVIQISMSDSMNLFNRALVRRHRDRAAAAWHDNDFLFRETADRLVDRMLDTTRTYPRVLDLGCHGGEVGAVLAEHMAGPLREKLGIETLVQADLSPKMASIAAVPGRPAFVCDEEALPIAPASLDAVLSNLSLHWVNDLPGALVQARRVLKPDGLFLACMLGGETLHELRDCLAEAEIQVEGGLSPRVSPFADVRDAGGLLQRAGFALPVVDADTITVSYTSAVKLMADLRGMGETNAVHERRKTVTRRETLMTAAGMYQERHADADGRIPATFQVLFLTAWHPHESQQKPLAPGSASGRLADALETDEVSLGEKARPKG